MRLWFFTGPQKLQLSRGNNGITFHSLVLHNLFYPPDHTFCHWQRVSPFSFSGTSILSTKIFSPVCSPRGNYCSPNADFPPLPGLRFITINANKNGGVARGISSTHTCLMEVNNPADFKQMTNVHEVQHKCNWLQARGLDADPRIWLQQHTLMLISLILILVKGIWHRTCLLKGLKYMCILFK